VQIPPTEGAPKRTSGSMTTGDSRLASGRQRTAVMLPRHSFKELLSSR
jgi:hypothetical protein